MSCKLQVAATIGFFFLLLTGSAATADSLPVGFLSFDQFSNGYALDLTNLTQPGGGSSVTTFLDLSSFTLTATFVDGSSSTVALSLVDPFGDLGTGPIFPLGQVISGTLTGTFSTTSVVLSDGSTATIDTASATLLSDPAGPLVAGDFALVSANTRQQAVPEPSTMPMLAAGLLLLLCCSRTNWHFRAPANRET